MATQKQVSYGEIASQVDVCRNTVTNMVKLYKAKGLAGLTQVNFRGKQSELASYENFDDFTKAIETSLEEVNALHQAEFESLLSLKFQSFHKS